MFYIYTSIWYTCKTNIPHHIYVPVPYTRKPISKLEPNRTRQAKWIEYLTLH